MAESIFAVIFCLTFTSIFTNDIRMGIDQSESRKIYSEIWEANPAIWVRTEEVTVNATGNDVISAIDVIDYRDDKDGEAYVKNGGICQKSVTIAIRSPSILRGYKFRIDVYAFDPNSRYYSKGYNTNPCANRQIGNYGAGNYGNGNSGNGNYGNGNYGTYDNSYGTNGNYEQYPRKY